jgi:hypothetical protein
VSRALAAQRARERNDALSALIARLAPPLAAIAPGTSAHDLTLNLTFSALNPAGPSSNGALAAALHVVASATGTSAVATDAAREAVKGAVAAQSIDADDAGLSAPWVVPRAAGGRGGRGGGGGGGGGGGSGAPSIGFFSVPALSPICAPADLPAWPAWSASANGSAGLAAPPKRPLWAPSFGGIASSITDAWPAAAARGYRTAPLPAAPLAALPLSKAVPLRTLPTWDLAAEGVLPLPSSSPALDPALAAALEVAARAQAPPALLAGCVCVHVVASACVQRAKKLTRHPPPPPLGRYTDGFSATPAAAATARGLGAAYPPVFDDDANDGPLPEHTPGALLAYAASTFVSAPSGAPAWITGVNVAHAYAAGTLASSAPPPAVGAPAHVPPALRALDGRFGSPAPSALDYNGALACRTHTVTRELRPKVTPPPHTPLLSLPLSGARPTAGAVVGAWPGGFSSRFSDENEPVLPSLSRPPVDASATLLAYCPPPPVSADGRVRLPTDVVPAAERHFVFAQTGAKRGDVWSQTDPLTAIEEAEAAGDFVRAAALAVARGTGPAVNEGVDELSDDSESDPDAEKGDAAVTLSLDVMRARARLPGGKGEEVVASEAARGAWAPARDHLLQAAAAADVAAALKDARWLTDAISGV